MRVHMGGGYQCSFQFPSPTDLIWLMSGGGSSGPGKIRVHAGPISPDLGILQVPLSEWSAASKRRLWAFDLYSLTITDMENCLESESQCLVTHHISSECKINVTNSSFCATKRCDVMNCYPMLGDPGDSTCPKYRSSGHVWPHYPLMEQI